MRLIAICSLAAASLLDGQVRRAPSALEPPDTKTAVDFAIANAVTDGDFHFLPFPPSTTAFLNRDARLPADKEPFQPYKARLITSLLSEYERRKGVAVVTFSIERDQKGCSSWPLFHGIFVKTIPVSRPER